MDSIMDMDDEDLQFKTEEEERIEEEEMYERERLENIRKNADLMASLGLLAPVPVKKASVTSEEARVKRESRIRAAELKRAVEPTRRSGRVAANQPKPGEIRSEDIETLSGKMKPAQVLYSHVPRGKAPVIPEGPEYEMSGPQSDQPRPERAADGVLIFEGRWRDVFKPNVTPEEMFAGGAFCGAFFCNTRSQIIKAPLSAHEDVAALPFTFSPRQVETHLSSNSPASGRNRFGVKSGQTLQEWEQAGWIWAGDPRGWAQWYTRFWAGRRCEDDERQIKRWLKVAGPTGRFKNALIKKIVGSGGKEAIANERIGNVVRQCLWQWGYEFTESEYDKVMEGKQ